MLLHVKKLSWLFILPVVILLSSCSKSDVPPPPVDEAEWLQQPRGVVVETGGFSCNYFIVQNQMGSTSLIQRRMKLGYNRAGRLMDQLEAAGIVGENKGSKARDVLVRSEDELNEILERI